MKNGHYVHPLSKRRYDTATVTLPGHLMFELEALTRDYGLTLTEAVVYRLSERQALECARCRDTIRRLHPEERK